MSFPPKRTDEELLVIVRKLAGQEHPLGEGALVRNVEVLYTPECTKLHIVYCAGSELHTKSQTTSYSTGRCDDDPLKAEENTRLTELVADEFVRRYKVGKWYNLNHHRPCELYGAEQPHCPECMMHHPALMRLSPYCIEWQAWFLVLVYSTAVSADVTKVIFHDSRNPLEWKRFYLQVHVAHNILPTMIRISKRPTCDDAALYTDKVLDEIGCRMADIWTSQLARVSPYFTKAYAAKLAAVAEEPTDEDLLCYTVYGRPGPHISESRVTITPPTAVKTEPSAASAATE